MRTFRWMSWALASTLLLGVPVLGQQFENVPEAKPAAPAAAGSQITIGVINAQLAMARTQEGRKAAEDLEAQFSPRQAELQKLQEEVRALEEQLRTQERTLSDDARMQLLRELEQKRKQGTRKQQDLQEDMQDAQTDYISRIGARMQQIIDRYARENNLNVIFNIGPGGPVIYATAAVDITDEIIALYDQTHPVEATSGTESEPSARSNPPQR